MIRFKINEIPSGISEEFKTLSNEDFDTNGIPLLEGKVAFRFEKFDGVVRVGMHINAVMELICDRSLESYPAQIRGEYQVIFDSSVKEIEESERTTLKPLVESSNQIDLTNEIRETLLLNVPVKKLHPRFYREDGSEISFEEAYPDQIEEEPDSRWDALKKLQNNN